MFTNVLWHSGSQRQARRTCKESQDSLCLQTFPLALDFRRQAPSVPKLPLVRTVSGIVLNRYSIRPKNTCFVVSLAPVGLLPVMLGSATSLDVSARSFSGCHIGETVLGHRRNGGSFSPRTTTPRFWIALRFPLALLPRFALLTSSC
jgi:hypothetical protein